MAESRKITRRDGAMRVYPVKDGAQITCGHPVALTAAGQLVACGDPADTIAGIAFDSLTGWEGAVTAISVGQCLLPCAPIITAANQLQDVGVDIDGNIVPLEDGVQRLGRLIQLDTDNSGFAWVDIL